MAGRSTVENVDVTLSATDKASRTVDDVAKKLDGLDDVEVDVDAKDDATKVLDAVEADRRKLDGADATVEIDDHGAQAVKDHIRDILTGADKVNHADATLDVDVDTHDSRKRLDDVAGGADHVRESGEKSVDPLRDISGSLGDIGSTGLDAADGIKAIGEVIPQFLPQFAGAASAFAGIGLAVGVGSLLVAGLQALPGLFDSVSEKEKITQKSTEDLTKAFEEAADQTDVWNQHLIDTLKANPDLVAANNALKISGSQYAAAIKGEAVPALDAARKFLDDYTTALDSNRDATKPLINVQQEFAAAHGLTRDQLLDLIAKIKTTTTNVDAEKTALTNATATANAYHTAIAGIPTKVETTVEIQAETSAFEAALRSIKDEVARTQLALTIGANLMAGTPYAQGGVYTVGEAGPERVFLPRGSRVATAGQTAAMDRADTGAVTNIFNVTVNVPVGYPTAEVGRYVAAALDVHERRAGRRRRAVA